MEENQEFFIEEDYVNQPLNCRKQLAIIFIHDMVMENTNPNKAFSSTDIIDRLDAYPYSLRIERRAVADALNILTSEFPYICKNKEGKVWFNREEYKLAG